MLTYLCQVYHVDGIAHVLRLTCTKRLAVCTSDLGFQVRYSQWLDITVLVSDSAGEAQGSSGLPFSDLDFSERCLHVPVTDTHVDRPPDAFSDACIRGIIGC